MHHSDSSGGSWVQDNIMSRKYKLLFLNASGPIKVCWNSSFTQGQGDAFLVWFVPEDYLAMFLLPYMFLLTYPKTSCLGRKIKHLASDLSAVFHDLVKKNKEKNNNNNNLTPKGWKLPDESINSFGHKTSILVIFNGIGQDRRGDILWTQRHICVSHGMLLFYEDEWAYHRIPSAFFPLGLEPGLVRLSDQILNVLLIINNKIFKLLVLHAQCINILLIYLFT